MASAKKEEKSVLLEDNGFSEPTKKPVPLAAAATAAVVTQGGTFNLPPKSKQPGHRLLPPLYAPFSASSCPIFDPFRLAEIRMGRKWGAQSKMGRMEAAIGDGDPCNLKKLIVGRPILLTISCFANQGVLKMTRLFAVCCKEANCWEAEAKAGRWSLQTGSDCGSRWRGEGMVLRMKPNLAHAQMDLNVLARHLHGPVMDR
ncbi:Zinc finger protein GLI2, partial [Ophiophagus hannah]